MPHPFYVTVKAAVWKGSKLLLQHEICRGEHQHDLPGGRIEEGEDPKQGLRREVMEEIGVELSWISQSPVDAWAAEGSDWPVLGLVYEAQVESEEFRYDQGPTQEVESAHFYTLDEFEKTPDFDYKPFILQYFRNKISQ